METYPDVDGNALEMFIDLQAGNDLELFGTLADELAEEFTRFSASIESAVEQGDVREVARLSHELTGLAATFGLFRVSHTAEAVDRHGRRNEVGPCLDLARGLPAMMDTGIRRLNECVASRRSD